MALAEALARGLPVVCTTGGAAAETVPDAAAIKVAPGDARALSAALARVLDDAGLRRSLGDAAWAAARTLPRWQDTARIIAGAIAAVAPGNAAIKDRRS
jgi:glycosyltransferase involved in cell wall biosynthesis